MLKVTVDLVPFGYKDFTKNLYTLLISNVGYLGVTVNKEGKKCYSYRVRTIDEQGAKRDHGIMVKGFDRDKPAYELINLITEKLNKKGFFKRARVG